MKSYEVENLAATCPSNNYTITLYTYQFYNNTASNKLKCTITSSFILILIYYIINSAVHIYLQTSNCVHIAEKSLKMVSSYSHIL
jgi:hypothetical protein